MTEQELHLAKSELADCGVKRPSHSRNGTIMSVQILPLAPSVYLKDGPENLRFHAVSNRYLSQISWLLTNPLMAHDIGSIETENQWVERLPIKSGGFTNPFTGSPPQPTVKQRVYVDHIRSDPS